MGMYSNNYIFVTQVSPRVVLINWRFIYFVIAGDYFKS